MFASEMVTVTSVSAPPALIVNVIEFPAPGAVSTTTYNFFTVQDCPSSRFVVSLLIHVALSYPWMYAYSVLVV